MGPFPSNRIARDKQGQLVVDPGQHRTPSHAGCLVEVRGRFDRTCTSNSPPRMAVGTCLKPFPNVLKIPAQPDAQNDERQLRPSRIGQHRPLFIRRILTIRPLIG